MFADICDMMLCRDMRYEEREKEGRESAVQRKERQVSE
jgi:ribosomal protein S9